MFRTTLLAAGVLYAFTSTGQARADEVSDIVDKAVRAHGLKPENAKNFAYRGKNKGMLHINGMDLEFKQEMAVQAPDKFKEAFEMTVMNQQFTVKTVYNGKEGWIKANNMDIKVEKEILEEFKDAAHMMQLSQSLLFKDKALKVAVIGEAQVNGKPAVGLRVSKEGKKDLNFYFDKATGLMVKTERRARDQQTKQEVNEERIITEFQELKGRKVAKKVEIKRDGKAFLEVEVVESELPDSIDESEFAKP